MSTMLEQAIIDAEALKEAAVLNAEQIVIEKYQTEIKEAVETLLEQPEEEDPMADPLGAGEEIPETDEELAKQIPLASTEGEKLCPCPGEEEEIEIDFDQLAAQMKAEEEGAEAGGGEVRLRVLGHGGGDGGRALHGPVGGREAEDGRQGLCSPDAPGLRAPWRAVLGRSDAGCGPEGRRSQRGRDGGAGG